MIRQAARLFESVEESSREQDDQRQQNDSDKPEETPGPVRRSLRLWRCCLLQHRPGRGRKPLHELKGGGRQDILRSDPTGMDRNAAPECDLRRLDVGLVTDPPIFDAIAQTVIPRTKPPHMRNRRMMKVPRRLRQRPEAQANQAPNNVAEECAGNPGFSENIPRLSFRQVFTLKSVRQRRTASPGAGSLCLLLRRQHAPPPPAGLFLVRLDVARVFAKNAGRSHVRPDFRIKLPEAMRTVSRPREAVLPYA